MNSSVICERSVVIPVSVAHVVVTLLDSPGDIAELDRRIVGCVLRSYLCGSDICSGLRCSCVSVNGIAALRDVHSIHSLLGSVVCERILIGPCDSGCIYRRLVDLPCAFAELRSLVVLLIEFESCLSHIDACICCSVSAVYRLKAVRQSVDNDFLLVAVIRELSLFLPFCISEVVLGLLDAPVKCHVRNVRIIVGCVADGESGDSCVVARIRSAGIGITYPYAFRHA